MDALTNADHTFVFLLIVRFPHARVKDIARIARVVCLPDWQGRGSRAAAGVPRRALHGAAEPGADHTLHPRLLGYLRASPCWRYAGPAQPALIVGPQSKMRAKQTSPRGLQLGTFEY